MSETMTKVGGPEEQPVYEPFQTTTTVEDMQDAMDAYVQFVALPSEERAKVTYIDESRPRTGKAGYTHNGEFAPDGSPLKDNKHKFHYVQAMDNPLLFARKNLAMEARVFLTAASKIHAQSAEAVKRACEKWEEDMPGITGILAPRSGKNAHHSRFLAYQRGKKTELEPQELRVARFGRILARGHYDKSWGTIAGWNNKPGLRIGTGPEDLELVDQGGYNPIFFRGFGFHQLAEMHDVDVDKKAGWHDVVDVDTGDNTEGLDEDDPKAITRLTHVYFINPANMYLDSTEEQTHTPINWRNVAGVARTVHDQSFLV